MRLTDFDTDESPRLPMDFVNNMKHTSDFDDMSVPYFDRLAVLVMEDIATPEERAEYAKLLSVSEKNQESASIYSKCRLRPDATIQMPDAQGLKRQGRVIPLVWKICVAAAAVAVGCFALVGNSEVGDVRIDGVAQSQYVVSNPIVLPDKPAVGKGGIELSSVPKKNNKAMDVGNVFVPDEPMELEFLEPEADGLCLVGIDGAAFLDVSVADDLPGFVDQPWDEASGPARRNPVAEFCLNAGYNAVHLGRRILHGGQKVVRCLPSPIELERNENGEVESCSLLALNRKFTYRF